MLTRIKRKGNQYVKVRQMAHIALMGAILYAVFQAFSNILYLEMITFTILCFAQVFVRKEVVLSCVLFACIQILFNGLTLWNIMYLLIFPMYGWIFSKSADVLKDHLVAHAFLAGFFSFLTGQLVDLPFLLFSKTVTLLYMLMGLKTSLIQGCLTFIVTLFLFEPVVKVLYRIQHERIE